MVKHEDHFNYLNPLRLAGYRTEYYDLSNNKSQVDVLKKIDQGYFDAVCMFNPYMHSHSDLYVYFAYAKNAGLKPIVIERGALPESWYYAEDMAYVDSDYDLLDLEKVAIPSSEILDGVFDEIKSGSYTLEKNGSYESTLYKYRLIQHSKYKRKIFVPLQLSDDSAVTRFVGDLKTYEEYISNLKECFAEHADVLFLVKRHPLASSHDVNDEVPGNVIICDDNDNVHALIDLSDAIICYNSGVGLLALMHDKPVYTVGRSFYSKAHFDLAVEVSLPCDAINLLDVTSSRNPQNIRKFVYWLLTQKYSFYKSESVIRDFGHRKSHGYKDSKCYSFNYEGAHFMSKCLSVDHPFSMMSYGAAKLSIQLGLDQYNKDVAHNQKAKSSRSEGKKVVAVPSVAKPNAVKSTSSLVEASDRIEPSKKVLNPVLASVKPIAR